MKKLPHFLLDLLHHLGMLPQVQLGVLTALTNLIAIVSKPGSAFLYDAAAGRQFQDISLSGNSLAEHNIKLCFFKGRRDLVFYHLDAGTVSHHPPILLDRLDPAPIHPDGSGNLHPSSSRVEARKRTHLKSLTVS